MKDAHFKVFERLDLASTPQQGTVTIDRTRGLFTVRPLRRHRVYELPLSAVARMVCQHVIRVELVEKRRAKLAAKKARRG